MKRVGLILRDNLSINSASILSIRMDLLKYLRKYDIQVVCIPVLFHNNVQNEFKKVLGLIKECDGIILPGGDNYHEIDLKIAKYLYEQDIPTLGICLGMQILSLTFNGKIEPIGNDTHYKKTGYVHQITIKEKSRLEKILNEKTILVNSRHKEKITKTDLNIVAVSHDQIIEAVEDKNKKFFIGVEWHPESLEEDSNSKKLFDAFIDSL